MKIKDLYYVFKGMKLNVSGEYTPWTDEDDHGLNITRVGRWVRFSMGVGHFDDYSKVFLECEELLEQLTDELLPVCEKLYEEGSTNE